MYDYSGIIFASLLGFVAFGQVPDVLSVLAFEPPHAQWNVQGARAVIKGAAALDAANWPEVTEQNKAGFRFFKVEVEMP